MKGAGHPMATPISRWLCAGLRRAAFGLSAAACAGGCSARHIAVGVQCPSPYTGHATIAGGDAGQETLFGTSCAAKGSDPCSGELQLDKDGCPTFVTFGSCGGDICLGDQLIQRSADAGSAGEDAGSEQDGGTLGEGSSAH